MISTSFLERSAKFFLVLIVVFALTLAAGLLLMRSCILPAVIMHPSHGNVSNTIHGRDMAMVPAGVCLIGAETPYPDHEVPITNVMVNAFYMDRYEVTKRTWQSVITWATNNGYMFDYYGNGKAPHHPIHSVNWYDAAKWCNARSEMEGCVPCYYTSSTWTQIWRIRRVDIGSDCVDWNCNGYRLPTEVEWEKAAKGGFRVHLFPWSDDSTIDHSRANYVHALSCAEYAYHPLFNDGVFPYTSPVGHFDPNGLGLYDMAGNVEEWCWDKADVWSPEPRSPHGPSNGQYRVVRGGSWANEQAFCRCTYRQWYCPADAFNTLGFRTVRVQLTNTVSH